ncbi:MAG: aminodeoxychorismate/anthranilate synthase component II [Planctomycetales bacterium]|nr:aminodeoxychorismate/anthranilate synthase component II [Planctomycetales bacterium]
MLLLIDNYDSFVHNLARYFERLGQETVVVRNDALDIAKVFELQPSAIVLSPGPCTPDEAGVSLGLVREFHDKLPILGICLGHQTIAAALGARVLRSNEPMHGRTSSVHHGKTPLFSQIPSPFTACRYHSLVVDPQTLSKRMLVTARTDDGTVMAIEHVEYPVFGVQFHPEAVLTEHGYQLLANFLSLAGLSIGEDVACLTVSELRTEKEEMPPLPQQPVTF